jgi:CBS domain-containing protein
MQAKTVADVMQTEVLKVRDDLSLEELATFLLDHEISGAPVVDDNDGLVGVVSLVDVAKARADQGGVANDLESYPDYFDRSWGVELAPEEMHWLRVTGDGRRVRDVMSTQIYSVPENTPIADAVNLLLKARIHRLLVMREGQLAGIVASSDLLALLTREA